MEKIDKLTKEQKQNLFNALLKVARERNPQLFKELTEEQKKMIEELKARK
jgi:hypothetical protein